MAKKISLINMKGGVGKSTVAVNLAWYFAAYRRWLKKVLIIDLDPQFNASQYLLGIEKYENLKKENKPTIWNIFEQNTVTPAGVLRLDDPHDPIYRFVKFTEGSRIDLIPSRLELANSLKNPGQKERLLSKLISKIEEEYDIILIDCAPTESILTTAAYLASDFLLVPVKPDRLSTIGLPLLVNSMENFKQEYDDHDLDLAGIVFNSTTNYSPEEDLSKGEVRDFARGKEWYVFNAEIPYSRSFPKGAREGKPLFDTSRAHSTPKNKFFDFVIEVAERIGL